jgi:hypothetical protein
MPPKINGKAASNPVWVSAHAKVLDDCRQKKLRHSLPHSDRNTPERKAECDYP